MEENRVLLCTLLGVDPEDHPVMLTEAPMNPAESRARAVEVIFDRFGVPFVYVAVQPVLALYAAGRCTGVVFDSGDGVSHSVPVFEGYSLPHAIQRFPLAGHDVTLHLRKEQGVCLRTSAELEIVREMKERCCRVALDYEAELTSSTTGGAAGEMSYTLPDGQVLCLASERFSRSSVRTSTYGGSSWRTSSYQCEVAGLTPGSAGARVRVSSPAGRDSSVWRGGAALAGLSSPAGCPWISREEYEEYGPQIVLRKCF
ncbi:hypothetical protein CRUP_001878 [Coryphaenoides rupestris]|nr:hypothetical protein CRUP_001878 [Coryphaenoides rupestris]